MDCNLDKKLLMCKFTPSGACCLRRDLKSLRTIQRLQNEEAALITKRIRAILFPWNFEKVRIILNTQRVESLEKGVQEILGKIVKVETINILFSQSSAYERLSKMNYQKSSEKIAEKKGNKIIQWRKQRKGIL